MIHQIVPGELLPWKGKWFKVADVDGDKITIVPNGSKTRSAEKRDTARERWLKQHPNAKELR